MESFQLGPVTAVRGGDQGAPIVLVAGPPASAALFAKVQERLLPRRTVAVELLTTTQADRPPVELLAEAVEELGAEVLVAHGLAVPLALRVDVRTRVISNGPVRQLDPLMLKLARMPARALEQLLRPGVLQAWMPSSVGLRRLVVNPYVMDRDMAVTLSAPMGASGDARRFAAEWIRSLPGLLAAPVSQAIGIKAIWGDGDVLYPVAEARSLVSDAQLRTVPGGRHLHPVERPWAFADALVELLEG